MDEAFFIVGAIMLALVVMVCAAVAGIVSIFYFAGDYRWYLTLAICVTILAVVGIASFKNLIQKRQHVPHPLSQDKVFVSYRRDNTAGETIAISIYLRSQFGHDAVFMDSSSVKPGVVWPERIQTALASADYLFVIIGPNWLGETPSGRRIDDEEDWIRREVHHALKREIHITPVIVRRDELFAKSELPVPIQGLLDRQAVYVRTEAWDNDIRVLRDIVVKTA